MDGGGELKRNCWGRTAEILAKRGFFAFSKWPSCVIKAAESANEMEERG